MQIQKWGGLAAIVQGLTYVAGFILFFLILDAGDRSAPADYLIFFIDNRDTFFIGYLIIGVLFSLALMILVQAMHKRFYELFPDIMMFTTAVGYIWAAFVMASSFIFLTSIGVVSELHTLQPEQSLAINRTISLVVDALGGGIELIGAIWVLMICYVGIRASIFSGVIHYWGILVGAAGVLTLFSGLSFLETSTFFAATTALFGLGQIIWFWALGIAMLVEQNKKT